MMKYLTRYLVIDDLDEQVMVVAAKGVVQERNSALFTSAGKTYSFVAGGEKRMLFGAGDRVVAVCEEPKANGDGVYRVLWIKNLSSGTQYLTHPFWRAGWPLYWLAAGLFFFFCRVPLLGILLTAGAIVSLVMNRQKIKDLKRCHEVMLRITPEMSQAEIKRLVDDVCT